MQSYKFNITSVPGSELFFGKPVFETKLPTETHEQLAERTWKQKINVDKNGQAAIVGFAVKNALQAAAKRLSMKLSGKATYTKLFVQGTVAYGPFALFDHSGKAIMMDDVLVKKLFVPSGQGDNRVMRCFPYVEDWQTEVEIHTFDDRITEEIMRTHLITVGQYIGFGSMRVENGGLNGRFTVE